jgi:hypothetical protein
MPRLFLHLILLAAIGSSCPASNLSYYGNCTTNSSSTPVAASCGPTTANVTCINRYGSLLPASFSRDPYAIVGYTGTLVPGDPSWAEYVIPADFVLFDKQRGLEILGQTPRIFQKYIDVINVVHEAPIYVPALNQLFVTQDGPPGNLSNLILDLNYDPPEVSLFVTDPPIYQPTGGILYNGMIYWTVQGNNASLPNGEIQRPGIARVDPQTLKAEMLVNNYFGFFFNGPNDLAIDEIGDIWFTDSCKSTLFDLKKAPLNCLKGMAKASAFQTTRIRIILRRTGSGLRLERFPSSILPCKRQMASSSPGTGRRYTSETPA